MKINVVPEKPQLADWAQNTGTSPLQHMMSVANRSDIISFSLGLPAAQFFPANEMAEALQSVLRREPFALQYSFPCPSLKSHIVSLSREKRCRLAELASAYRVPIIEDNAYGFINYESGQCEPPIPLFVSEVRCPKSHLSWSKVPARRSNMFIASHVPDNSVRWSAYVLFV